MASFNYSNVTYGRSTSALNNTLIPAIDSDFKAIGNVITGSEYNVFINTVKKNWAGADADKFIALFKNDVQASKAKLTSYRNQIVNALTNDNAQFAKSQSNIANSL